MPGLRSYGNWALCGKLGQGGFGEVLLWQNHDGRKIATKHIKDVSSLGADQQIKLDERWRQEFKWTLEFQNLPHIVAGVRLAEDQPFVQYLNESHICKLPVIILEYCNGGDVRKLLQKPANANGLRELQVREILRSMRGALHFLHSECEVCHRDLKPDNIVIQLASNGKKIYKLTDFGLARSTPDKTMLQSVVGTRHYFAPEVISTGVYNETVDYWSLGIIAYELVTGSLPFIPHQGPVNILTNILKKPSKCIHIREDTKISERFHFDTVLPQEHHLTRPWAEQFAEWLRLPLNSDYRQRGQMAATDEVQPLVFTSLDSLLQITVLTVFVVSCYKRLEYIISPKMKMKELLGLISKDTQISIDAIHFVLPTGHPHRRLTVNTQPIDLYVEEWLDTSEEAQNPPVMLYVLNANLRAETQITESPKLSQLLIDCMFLSFENNPIWLLDRLTLDFHHLLIREQEHLKMFLLGLKEYAMSVEDAVIEYEKEIQILLEEKLRTCGAQDQFEKLMQAVQLPQNPEWLKLVSKHEEKHVECMRLVNKTKEKFDSVLRNARQKVKEAQRACEDKIQQDVFRVHSFRKNHLVLLNQRRPLELQTFGIDLANARDNFLKDPDLVQLRKSIKQLHYMFSLIPAAWQNCGQSLMELQRQLLQLQVQMVQTLQTLKTPEPPAVLQLSESLQRMTVDGSGGDSDCFDSLTTNDLLNESLRLERLMRQDMETN